MKTSIENLKQKSIKRYLAENGIYPAREYATYALYIWRREMVAS